MDVRKSARQMWVRSMQVKGRAGTKALRREPSRHDPETAEPS